MAAQVAPWQWGMWNGNGRKFIILSGKNGDSQHERGYQDPAIKPVESTAHQQAYAMRYNLGPYQVHRRQYPFSLQLSCIDTTPSCLRFGCPKSLPRGLRLPLAPTFQVIAGNTRHVLIHQQVVRNKAV